MASKAAATPMAATIAILSDPIVPYLQYSLFYIIIVLAVYSCHLMTDEAQYLNTGILDDIKMLMNKQ